MRVRGAFVSTALTAILVASAPAALAGPRHVTIVGGQTARTISTSTAGGRTTGSLVVLVRNDSLHYARPTAQFIPAAPADTAVLTTKAKPLAPGRVESISLTFTALSSSAMNGNVAIGLSGRRPIREQTIQVTPEAPASGPAVEPAEVTLHLTRLCPGKLGHLLCGSSPAPTIAVSASALAALGSGSKRLAASGGGGRATITLVPTKAASGTRTPDGLVPVKVYVRDDSHGEYNTTFTLDPEAKQDGAIKVKVEVQIWWLYPLLVLLGGAFLGYLVRWLGGSHRDRDVLKGRLEAARNLYSEELPGRSPGVYPLEHWFGQFSQEVPAIPRRREYDSDDLSGFAEAWKQVQQAKSSTDITEADKIVKQLELDLLFWRKVNGALKHLDVSFKEAVPDEKARSPEIPAYRDTLSLVAHETVTQPGDQKALQAALEAIVLQGKIVAAYEPARVAWNSIVDDTGSLEQYDPKKIYGSTAVAPLARESSVSKTIRDKLEAVPAALASHPQRTSSETTETADAETAHQALTAGAAAPAKSTPPDEKPPGKKRDPFHLSREITLTDSIVFGLTLLASSVVYLLTLYVGKSFGSSSQYVQAFAAGFAGQALVGVAAFPLAQSLLNVGDKGGGA
jgi:hypothetical protein